MATFPLRFGVGLGERERKKEGCGRFSFACEESDFFFAFGEKWILLFRLFFKPQGQGVRNKIVLFAYYLKNTVVTIVKGKYCATLVGNVILLVFPRLRSQTIEKTSIYLMYFTVNENSAMF